MGFKINNKGRIQLDAALSQTGVGTWLAAAEMRPEAAHRTSRFFEPAAVTFIYSLNFEP
jgi:hypothetical protein